jgi:quercetin 2,3-dioxygenase
MNHVLHRAETRGHANHGWLDSSHTFSFGTYYDPMRVQFGALRVLNDDVVDGGKGFGSHPHDNMEIVSIPLYGDLEHKDSMGNVAVIRENDVQIMSAGKGIYHSEYNKNPDQRVNFLQIWIFPKEKNIQPRYGQKSFSPDERLNKLQVVVSPDGSSGGVVINQDAWLSLGKIEKGVSVHYTVNKNGNGVYAFAIKGNFSVNGYPLNQRDGFGIWETDSITVEATSDAEILLIEVPMN